MPAQPLTGFEREEIRVGVCSGDSDAVIARRLGRHRSTIGRELARNGGRACYTATGATQRADRQRQRPKTSKLESDAALAEHVTARLEALDSPMTISIELTRGTHAIAAKLSHESIYSAIYAQGTSDLPAGLHTRLHRRRRCRKHRVFGPPAPTTSPLGPFNPISARPAVADGRREVGHLEGDLIIGARNQSAIVTCFDRASRHVWLACRRP